MTDLQIQNFLNQGEGLTIEFKATAGALPKNLFETVCAFLNRSGGTILLGVSDGGEVLGVEPTLANKICMELASLSNNPNKIDPGFLLYPTVIDFRGNKLIHVFVPASSQVHRTNGMVFDRSSDGDFRVKTDDRISQIYLRKSVLFSESTIYPFLRELDFEVGVIDRVRKIIRINRPDHPWNELTNSEFFRIAGLFRRDMMTGDEGFTLAALLLFGKEEVIQSAIPFYKIDALVRKVDLDRYDDRENIRCNLIEAYDKLLDFTVKHLPDKMPTNHIYSDNYIPIHFSHFQRIPV